jgi:hypothetical protein
MRPEGEPQQPPSALVKLTTKAIFDCELDVKAKRILGAIPLSWSFAMRTLPPGASKRVPPDLGEMIVATAEKPADQDAKELEESLAKVLEDASDRDRVKAALRSDSPPPGQR